MGGSDALHGEEVFQVSTAADQIAGVRLRPPALEQIVDGETVDGYVGGRSVEIEERQQEELRRFLEVLRTPSVTGPRLSSCRSQTIFGSPGERLWACP